MLVDVMSVFDSLTYSKVSYSILVWGGSFLYLVLFMGMMFWFKDGRGLSILGQMVSIPFSMVNSSKMGIFGSSHLVLCTLFFTIFGINLIGSIPYSLSVSSHLVFSLSFGVPFWLGLVLSSLVFGKIWKSMAGLVFSGVPVVAGWFLCWVEVLSIFLRWITLSLRLSANMTIGQILMSMISSSMMFSYYYSGISLVVLGVMLLGVGLLVAELIVGFIQAYVFCLLLSLYSNEHSL